MHNVVAARVDDQRCTSCNHVVVDAWVCDECAWGMARSDDYRPRGAGFVARGRQRLVDQGAAFLLWLDLCGVVDSTVTPVDSLTPVGGGRRLSYASLSAKVRARLLRESNDIGSTKDAWAPPARVGKYLESPFVEVRRAARRARQEAA